ncbi:transmembrane protein 42-like [Patiria miniata]|uniref:EamA domain-containing protein n=1 Tax=Patiria miniata TaxID=46514 RepID=A0A914BJB3_PATMI|nr:transmembrane protein 42-like [Patiria miniata]
MLGLSLAVCAGLCAACASAFAKLAMSGEEIALVCQSLEESVAMGTLMPNCSVVTTVLRGISFSLLFLFNAIMWTLFVKSLQLARSSLEATITNSSANLFFTAVIGYVVFGEALSLTWGLGSTFIILGLWMIHRGGRTKDEAKER